MLRQAWLAGRSKRILILAPKAVLIQWQIELREKFNLNWPIYDGRSLNWYPSTALGSAASRAVSRRELAQGTGGDRVEPTHAAGRPLTRTSRGRRAMGSDRPRRGAPCAPARRRLGQRQGAEPTSPADAAPVSADPGPDPANGHPDAGRPGRGLGSALPFRPSARVERGDIPAILSDGGREQSFAWRLRAPGRAVPSHGAHLRAGRTGTGRALRRRREHVQGEADPQGVARSVGDLAKAPGNRRAPRRADDDPRQHAGRPAHFAPYPRATARLPQGREDRPAHC